MVATRFTERHWRTLDAVKEVAVRWVARRPGICSTIVGASRVEPLDANLRALDLELPSGLERELEEASRPDPAFTCLCFGGAIRGAIDGWVRVRAEQPWWRLREQGRSPAVVGRRPAPTSLPPTPPPSRRRP